MIIAVGIIACVGIIRLPDGFSVFTDTAPDLDTAVYTVEPDDDGTRTSASDFRPAHDAGQYTARLKLLGLLPVKTVTVDVIEKQEIRLCGQNFGIKLYTDGVIVVGTGDFLYGGKTVNPASSAGIRVGDRITHVNGTAVNGNEALTAYVTKHEGNTLRFTVIRKNMKFTADVTPIIPDGDKKYRIGLWVRDSTAGIGTLTYYNETLGTLAGLGHSVADIDTGEIMPSSEGTMVSVTITEIEKGQSGKAGELCGSFSETTYGSIIANTETGIFAKATDRIFEKGKKVDIALKNEITEGKAQLFTSVDGEAPVSYDVEIEKVNNNLKENKNMVIRITDPKLLKKTGGIIQGMSGSPVLQNGKLVGALTHVFVKDPTKGYAVFIEKMLIEENGLIVLRNRKK